MSVARRLSQLVFERWLKLSALMKIVSAATAIIGLILSGTQLYTFVSDYFTHRAEHKRFDTAIEAIATATPGYLSRGAYKLAWDENAKGLKLAPDDENLQSQQVEIAMRWLENARLNSAVGPKTFSELVQPLEEALLVRAASAHGTQLANIRAHIGWAQFLRSRDGVGDVHIDEEFDEALRVDPHNMYANVMRGFWILWRGGTVDAARENLDAALSSNVDPNYAARMVLAGLLNEQADKYELAAVEYAGRIRKLGRDVDRWTLDKILAIYEQGLENPDFLTQLTHIATSDDHVANLEWALIADIDEDRRRNGTVLQAYFLELSGKKTEALTIYQNVVGASPPFGSRAKDFAQAGITRLR